MEILSLFLFLTCLLSSLFIVTLSLVGPLTGRFQFYPPPKKEGWQHPTFIWLFRGIFYPLVLLSFLEFRWVNNLLEGVRLGLGVLFLFSGFGFAFWITFQMGWRNAFGEKKGLIKMGWFSRSRNPIYVASWIGLLGWILVVNHLYVTILAVIWGVLYFLAPLLEEPWLEKMYALEYKAYKAKTPRFF